MKRIKELFKTKKYTFIASGVALLLAVIMVAGVLCLPIGYSTGLDSETTAEAESGTAKVELDPDETTAKPIIVKPIVTTAADNDEADETDETIIDDTTYGDDVLTPAEPETTADETRQLAETNAQPVVVAEETETQAVTETSSGIIHIGGPIAETEAYSCGSANHHCTTAGYHSYICNLEIKGCEYCGSHSCPSFYAVNQWGQACYTPSKCPQYDITKDPMYYCQTCGKPCGHGIDKCVKYLTACNCPDCGVWCESMACHHCAG